MKIGILTFHWATNYGAILQAWCLQQYLMELGHEVEIIDYKPACYDNSWLNIAKHPSLWKTAGRHISGINKEKLLVPFRKKYLKTTRRYRSMSEFGTEINRFDVLISGSDQVLNPSFTLRGEDGSPSTVYWLGLGRKDARRIGYAVSFGCEEYPDNAATVAQKWVNGFNAIGTRERTGQQILEFLEYHGLKTVVPDPTLLFGKRIFEKLHINTTKGGTYTCVYMLRHEILLEGDIKYIDEKHKPLSMEQWLTTIANAKEIITNSYHGTLIAMYSHVPFVILLETGGGSGMNDRFFTLFEYFKCSDRVATTINDAVEILKRPIDFHSLDSALEEYRSKGINFLSENI